MEFLIAMFTVMVRADWAYNWVEKNAIAKFAFTRIIDLDQIEYISLLKSEGE